MANWYSSPIATLAITESDGGTVSVEASFNLAAPTVQVVPDKTISWTISQFTEYARYQGNNYDLNDGKFIATLLRQDSAGAFQQVDQVIIDRSLKSFDNASMLVLTATMANSVEVYQVQVQSEIYYGGQVTKTAQQTFTAIEPMEEVGALTYDCLPISIVYCPPNQDMSASLTNSSDFGTRMTIGSTNQFVGLPVDLNLDEFGMSVGQVKATASQSISNEADSTIEFSYFRENVLTADNQRAIGRAYWGPLNDIFVIAQNSHFNVFKGLSGTYFHQFVAMDNMLVVPAYKLLRPGQDPVATSIPAQARRQLLELDPFITNLDQFFPDSGADLSIAANPYQDPSAGNRAEELGRWWLNNGTELNYSIGQKKVLTTKEATQISFLPSVIQVGVDLSGVIGVGAQAGNNYNVEVGLQSSKETDSGTSVTAACYLIRNQNERDLEGIAIYYDKIFSTVMFRKLQSLDEYVPTGARYVSGRVRDLNRYKIAKTAVWLIPKGDPPAGTVIMETMTDRNGTFNFPYVKPGRYDLVAGDQVRAVEVVPAGQSSRPSLEIDLDGVRRVIDFQKSPVWEIALAFGTSAVAVRRLAQDIAGVLDQEDLASILGMSDKSITATLARLSITWPQTPLRTLEGITPGDIAAFEQAGIRSIQDLWRNKEKDAVAALAKNTNMSPAALGGLLAKANAMRVSQRKRVAVGKQRHQPARPHSRRRPRSRR